MQDICFKSNAIQLGDQKVLKKGSIGTLFRQMCCLDQHTWQPHQCAAQHEKNLDLVIGGHHVKSGTVTKEEK